jgi:hypothetical protein
MQNVKVRFAYKSGFRRLWLVLSVLWIAFSLNFTINQMSGVTVLDTSLSALLPPIVLYALGAAFVWIVEGFARPDR